MRCLNLLGSFTSAYLPSGTFMHMSVTVRTMPQPFAKETSSWAVVRDEETQSLTTLESCGACQWVARLPVTYNTIPVLVPPAELRAFFPLEKWDVVDHHWQAMPSNGRVYSGGPKRFIAETQGYRIYEMIAVVVSEVRICFVADGEYKITHTGELGSCNLHCDVFELAEEDMVSFILNFDWRYCLIHCFATEVDDEPAKVGFTTGVGFVPVLW
jgi:hypothetical protein